MVLFIVVRPNSSVVVHLVPAAEMQTVGEPLNVSLRENRPLSPRTFVSSTPRHTDGGRQSARCLRARVRACTFGLCVLNRSIYLSLVPLGGSYVTTGKFMGQEGKRSGYAASHCRTDVVGGLFNIPM